MELKGIKNDSNATESIFGKLISCLISGNIFVKQDFGIVSSTGFKPGILPHKNQDGFVIFTPTHGVYKNNKNGRSTKDKNHLNISEISDTRLYAVLDGHGNAGEILSAKARDLLLHYVLIKKPWEFEKSDIYYYEIFDQIQKRLEEEHGFDVDCSGTTCTVVSITGRKLQVC
jgi:serine/threonine protein phosphatase PrpC